MIHFGSLDFLVAESYQVMEYIILFVMDRWKIGYALLSCGMI